MVTNITSLTGNGLKDWLIQRVTAVYLAVYALFIFSFFLMHPELRYAEWHALFQIPSFKVATVLAFFTFILHSWIGIWTVTTDYIKCTVIRLSVQLLVALFLVGQFIWALMIVWGQ
ncbi:succinate dehydrogenase, hydrophobic membrane anchor protein [Legionella impletisoli]|uniref:Succinate dehydrogenase hydrophobic membrane anchor subunit n=1 Tax=Legionella impletisoli TaxID=343510 RepID=A0A917JXH6_9GAMM|nr:succinate dehydrogenase, hydrophobic membrane anchor protein [Legionella impletisoli]GGI88940.1 succinate dehydrogenase hydrophobic membrane anchor subunit [Legionella impletisoli]